MGDQRLDVDLPRGHQADGGGVAVGVAEDAADVHFSTQGVVDLELGGKEEEEKRKLNNSSERVGSQESIPQ